MEQNQGKKIKVFTFSETYEPPVCKYNKKFNFVEWGSDNLYPKFIIDLYNNYGSSTHKSIINRKVKMGSGNGISKKGLSQELVNYIDNLSLEDEIKKAFLDYELFNGFIFEIIWDKAGENITSIKHIPIHKVRIGVPNVEIPDSFFWYSNNWKEYSKKEEYAPEFVAGFNPNVKQGKQYVMFVEYNPENDGVYPIPGYSTSINWIETDYQISKFHLNEIKQGYTPSFMLNFATGIPLEEQQDEFFREFKKNFSSADGQKIIITYSEGKEQAPELSTINLNDSDERFTILKDQIDDNIVRGAEIPPQLVILTPGKLGSTEEREELLKEFHATYVDQRQSNMERVLNNILYAGGFNEEIELLTYEGEQTDEEVVNVDKNAEAQAVLRGSVGGVQALTLILQNVAANTMTRESALATIELIYGFTPEQARRLLGDVQEGQATNEPSLVPSITNNNTPNVG